MILFYSSSTTSMDKILAGKKSGLATDAWEAEIDAMQFHWGNSIGGYDLYELSAAEIAVVEGR